MRDLLELYQKSGATASRLGELHELVQPTLEELTDTLGYERAFVALVESGEEAGSAGVGVSVPEQMMDVLAMRARAEEPPGPLVHALHIGKPVRIDDVLRDSRVPDSMRAAYADCGLLAFAAIPL